MIEIPERNECFNCGGETHHKTMVEYQDIIFCSEECKEEYISWRNNDNKAFDDVDGDDE